MAVGGPFRKVSAGSPLAIPAEAYNAFIDAALATRGSGAKGSLPLEGGRQFSFARVRNDSGEDLERFGVLGIGESFIAPSINASEFARVLAFPGYAPTLDHLGRAGVAIEPIATGQFGRVILAGIVHVRVAMLDESHRAADVSAGDATKLRSAAEGSASLLWIEPLEDREDPAVAWCTARIAPVGVRRVRAIVTGSTEISPNRWRYSWSEARFVSGKWEALPLGYTEATAGFAYNGIESGNSAGGVQGNGVDVANLPAGFSIRPVGVNASISLEGPFIDGDGERFWAFDAVNMVDGACGGGA